MEGGKSRLDQIFPARKVRNSGVFLTATDSDALSVEKKKKQQKKNKSPGRRGSLEGFIVRDRQGNSDDLLPLSNAVGDEKRGGALEITESNITLAKPAVSLPWVSNNCLRSTTESRLQRCEAAAACATKSGSERTITTEEVGGHGDIGAQPRPWKVVQKAVDSVTASEEVARTAGLVDLQVAKQNNGETLEDDDTGKSHQITQFVNEFLAICCSGVAVTEPSLTTTKHVQNSDATTNRKRALLEKVDLGSSKKQCFVEEEKIEIHHARHPERVDSRWRTVESRVTTEDSIVQKQKRNLELLNHKESASVAVVQIEDKELESATGMADRMLHGVDSPNKGENVQVVTDTSRISGRCNQWSVSPRHVDSSFTKGLDVVENIQPDKNDALKTPTWKEKGPSLPPLSKSPEETNQQRGHDRNGTRSRYRTPKSRSKSMAKHEEGGGPCQSPHSSSTKKTGRGSSSSLKSVGWVYHSSLFSPGDAFWDEAIEAADGLLASNVEELQLGGAVDINTKPSGCTDDLESCQYEERTDSYPPVKQVLEPAKDTRSVDSCHSPLVAELRRGFVGATVLSDAEGIVSRNFSAQVSQMDVSPLPVRHFDFTSQTSPQYKSIDELLHQDASQSNFQCCSRSVLAKESLNERGTGTSQQTRMRVDDVELTGGNQECLSMGMVNGRSEIEDMQQSSAPTVAATSLGLTEQVSAAPGTLKEELTATRSNTEGEQTCSNKLEMRAMAAELSKAAGALETGKEALLVVPSADQSHVDLSEWLPPDICATYIKKGLRKLYPWQVECLQLDGILQGRSLVYCASTSAGKSLVAEVLMLRRILSTGKKAFLVLPYVALCSEKAEHLESLLEPLGKRVRGFYGAQGGASLPKDTSVAVCTIEKANLLINKLLEEGRLSELAIIVIDELHMVGDRDRGYLLELLLTKLRYAAGGGEAVSAGSSPGEGLGSSALWNTGLQIVGMSATMPNVSDVATWLQAAFYETDFRPVPLEEFMKIGNKIHKKNMELMRTIRKEADLGGKDPDHVVELCHEVVREGHSVLLFCSSRKGCETSARHIAKFLPAFTIVEKANMSGPKDGNAAVEELRKSPAGLDPVLAETLPAGVAYHHAGLTVLFCLPPYLLHQRMIANWSTRSGRRAIV